MFQKYNYVLEVYREQSFTKAAKRLFISQPSLSVAIRNIENEIGAPLFERNGAAVRPTEVGLAYLEAAQKMFYAEEEFNRILAENRGLQQGKLVVGSSNYLCSDVLPRVISRFRSLHPGVEIVLTEANSTRLREMLCSEEVDLVIDNYGDTPGEYDTVPLAEEQILLCVPAEHAVNRDLKPFQILPAQLHGTDHAGAAPAIDISMVKEEPFILLKSGNDMHDRAQQLFESCGMLPNVVFQVDQLNISYAMAESGLGAALMPDTFFRYRKHGSEVLLYRLQHPAASRMLHIAQKSGRYRTCAMAEFIRIAQETMDTEITAGCAKK